MSCRVRDTESDLQAERLWLTLPSLEWWDGHGVFQASPGHREAKSKGEWERYTQLNAEFQRIARGDKKAFLSE